MRFRKIFCCFLTVLTCLLLGAAPTFAQVGKKVSVQESWPYSDYGYYRLKVRVSENPLRPAVETTRYFLVATGRTFQSTNTIASIPFSLEAGDSFVDAEIYLPVQQDWNAEINLHIETDGNLRYGSNDLYLKQISLPSVYQDSSRTMLIVTSQLSQSESESTIISGRKPKREGKKAVSIVDAKFPSIDTIAGVFAVNQAAGNTTGGNATKSSTLDSPSVHAIEPDDLPQSWLGLTSVQLVLISESDLQSVIKNQPTSLKALVQWIAAGGSLIVTECGPNFEKASSIRSQLSGQAARTNSKNQPWIYATKRLWSQRSLIFESHPVYVGPSNNLHSSVHIDSSIRYNRLDSSYFAQLPAGVDLANLEGDLAAEPSLNARNGFALSELMQGRVFVVKDSMFTWTQREWIPLLNATALSGRGINERLAGISISNREDFMVPGVGQPPVRMFEFLICLFILVVGPVSYFVLKRQKRLQLLFVVVPTISLLACICLFAYALISEGLQVRGRIKSVTEIDHTTNQAVSHIRHSHYAGVQPSAYQFSDSDFVINCSQSNRVSTYRTEGGRSTLSGGDIRPRMPHQLLAVQNYQTEAKLAQLPPVDGKPQVQNQFSGAIRFAAFRIEDELFCVRDLQPGATATGELIGAAEAGSELKKLIVSLSPKVFDEFELNSTYNYSGYRVSFSNDAVQNPDCDFQLDELSRLSGPQLFGHNKTYIAILEDLDLINQPLPGIDYKHRIHVVRGKW